MTEVFRSDGEEDVGYVVRVKVVERVRVFTIKEKSIFEGVYPNWYDGISKVEE